MSSCCEPPPRIPCMPVPPEDFFDEPLKLSACPALDKGGEDNHCADISAILTNRSRPSLEAMNEWATWKTIICVAAALIFFALCLFVLIMVYKHKRGIPKEDEHSTDNSTHAKKIEPINYLQNKAIKGIKYKSPKNEEYGYEHEHSRMTNNDDLHDTAGDSAGLNGNRLRSPRQQFRTKLDRDNHYNNIDNRKSIPHAQSEEIIANRTYLMDETSRRRPRARSESPQKRDKKKRSSKKDKSHRKENSDPFSTLPRIPIEPLQRRPLPPLPV